MNDPVEIRINMDAVGRVEVNGPLQNSVVFLGLLEVAKQIFYDYHNHQKGTQGSKIVRPTFAPPKLRT